MVSGRTRTAFVGNISFDATEEELNTLFASVGPITNFRLVHDRDTGKRKGYGFVEYTDVESAQSAVRNLNDYELHGRTLRVNIADQDTRSGSGGPPPPASAGNGDSRKRKDPPLPPGGASGPPGGGAAGPSAPEVTLPASLDPIAAYVERQGRAQLFEFVQQAKHFTMTQPEKAASLLTAQPQLYCALQLAIDRLAGPHWPPPQIKPKTLVTPTGPWAAAAAAAAANQPPGAVPPPPHVKPEPTEPPAPKPAAAAGAPPPDATVSVTAAAEQLMLQQLLALTPEQLDALPPAQKQQVLELRMAQKTASL